MRNLFCWRPLWFFLFSTAGAGAAEGADAAASAMRAGRAWGAFLASPPAVIRLRHCPFLELAEGYDQLVCAIHLGLMQGALSGLGAPVTASRLEPFAEPGGALGVSALAR